MTKAIITSEKFEGQVVALYGEPGIGAEAAAPLLEVNFREATIMDKTKGFILQYLPLRYGAGFEQCFGVHSSLFKFAFATEAVDFERDFWNLYGLKENRIRAENEWKKLKENDRVLAAAGVSRYLRHLKNSSYGRSKAAPSKYLHDKYWLTDWDNVA